MFTEKEIELMTLLGRTEVASSRTLSILAGSNELTADRKRLQKLIRGGFVDFKWHGGRKIYFLTAKGLSQVETSMRRLYNPHGQVTDHSLLVADLAAYLHVKEKISADSILFDREMEQIKELKPVRRFSGVSGKRCDKTHAPDLAIGSTCYEMELTQKSKARLAENYATNAALFAKQVWIVPMRLATLQNKIRVLSEKHSSLTEVWELEVVEAKLKNVVLSDNVQGENVELELKQQIAKENIMEEFV